MWYIYKITNLLNNYCYIGQTNNYSRRKQQHLDAALSNPILEIDKMIKEYGEINFSFETLEQIPFEEEVNTRERFWINYFDSFKGKGYNKNQGGYRRTAPILTCDKITPQDKIKCQEYILKNLNGQQGNLLKIMWFFIMHDNEQFLLSKNFIQETLDMNPCKYYQARAKLCELGWLVDDIKKDTINICYSNILQQIKKKEL